MGRPRHLFLVLIPFLSAAITAVSFRYPGDEYGLWGVGALPGLWLTLFVGDGSPGWGFGVALAGGITAMAMLGAVLDKLRAPWVPWYALWVVAAGLLCATMLAPYPSWARAMSKNGSFQDYALSSLNMGLTLSTAATIVVTASLRAGIRVSATIRRMRRR